MTASGPAPFAGEKRFRKSAGAWLRMHAAGAKMLYAAMSRFFRDQAEGVAKELLRNGLGASAEVLLRPDADRELIETAAESLGELAARGAVAELSAAKRFAALRKSVPPALPTSIVSGIKSWLQTVMGLPFWGAMTTGVRSDLADALKASLTEGDNLYDAAKRVQTVLTDAGRVRAELIARTEATGALNAGSHVSRVHLTELGYVVEKEWMCIKDNDTRPDHLAASGTKVGVNDDFTVGGEKAAYPGDARLSPAQRCNCRCACLTILKEASE